MREKAIFIPYKIQDDKIIYFVGIRPDPPHVMQFPTCKVGDNIAEEKVVEAVKREMMEELGISDYRNFINTGRHFTWEKEGEKIREHIFAFELREDQRIDLEKEEFSAIEELNKDKARNVLTYENHKKILDEVDEIIKAKKYPKIFAVCGPGGGGKETILEIIGNRTGLKRARTVTTRERREGENSPGREFVSEETFDALFDSGKLVEKNYFGGKWYGSRRDDIESEIEQGRSVLIELDINGINTYKKIYSNSVSIFLKVDIDDLRRRMAKRGRETSEEIERRIEISRHELENFSICDYVIENEYGKIEETVFKILQIINKVGSEGN